MGQIKPCCDAMADVVAFNSLELADTDYQVIKTLVRNRANDIGQIFKKLEDAGRVDGDGEQITQHLMAHCLHILRDGWKGDL